MFRIRQRSFILLTAVAAREGNVPCLNTTLFLHKQTASKINNSLQWSEGKKKRVGRTGTLIQSQALSMSIYSRLHFFVSATPTVRAEILILLISLNQCSSMRCGSKATVFCHPISVQLHTSAIVVSQDGKRHFIYYAAPNL